MRDRGAFGWARLRLTRGLALGAALAGAVLLASGCGTAGLASKNADTAKGKQLFQQTCGACHTLADAGTQGKVGPNLDDAFAADRQQGFKESTIRNVIHDQILYPVSNPAGVITNPDGTTQRAPGMPAKLVTGSDAEDVAAYVASVAGLAAAGTSTQATTTTAPPPPPTSTAATTTTAPTTTAAATTTTGGGASAAVLAQGKQVFESAGCTACHTLKDAGATGTVGPNLDQKMPPMSLVVDRVTNGKGAMPPFGGQLSPEQIQAVAAYISTVAGK